MRKNYLAIALLSLVMLWAVSYVFIKSGSPSTRRAQQEDAERASHLYTIENSIHAYYNQYHALPTRLDQLTTGYNLTIKDPKTGTPYEYIIKPPYGFELCANFATDYSEENSNRYYSFGNIRYTKGRFCQHGEIPLYYRPVVNTPLTPN